MAKKVPETDSENLPECAIDFIKLVIKKMRYRKNVRADVMAELTAHFEDELKDCKTDEEKEQKGEELISNFGDVKLLGVLLRRAKKRCRPLWRTMVARTFQTIGLLILCLMVYIAWFLTGRPVITTDYLAQLNQIVRPVADESLNAAPLYEKAVEMYGKVSDDFLIFFAENYNEIADMEIRGRFRWRLRDEEIADDIRQLLSTGTESDLAAERRHKIESEVAQRAIVLLSERFQETTAGEKKFIKKWIEDQKEALGLVIAGAQKPYYWQKYANKQNTTEMMSVLLPHLAEFRKLARALCWRALLSAEQGRYEDAFSDIESCYRLGQHIKGDKTFLIEQLVGIAIEALATQRLRDILSEYEIDSIALTAPQKDFEQIIAGEDFAISFTAEKLSIYDVIQRSFTDGFDGGHIIPRHIAELVSEVRLVAGLSASIGGGSSPEKPKPGWLSERISDIKDVVDDVIDGAMRIFKWAKKGGYVLFFHPDKQQTFKTTQEFYDYWESIKLKTPAQIREEGIDIEKESMEIIKGNMLLEFFAPALSRVNEISWRVRTDTQSLIAILALLRYRLDKGAYPDDLNELLIAGYLKELPTDPYSDKPLIYKNTDDNFLLYSVGLNFKNDGGQISRDSTGRAKTWADEGDAVFWPVPKPQTPQELETRRPKKKLRGKTHSSTKAEQK